MYQIAEIYPSADIPDKYRKAFKLGNKQHQDSGVDGLIITNEGKSIAYQCKFRSGRVKPTYEELTKFGLTAVIATIVVQLPILLQ